MRICVVGAGAIGGVIAARLATAEGTAQDTDVSVLARGATLAAISGGGLRVSSAEGTITARVTASDDAAEIGEQDFVVVAVKSQSMAGVAASVGGLLGPETAEIGRAH